MNVRTASVRALDGDHAVTSVLLHKLAGDDEFRERFASCPRDVLAEYGVAAPADTPPTVTLPSKERFHAVLAEALEREAVASSDPCIFMWVV